MKLKVFIAILAAVIIVIIILTISRLNNDRTISKFSNIVLISLDTTRSDYLSCYGCPARTTPNIDAVAAEGFLFENVVSPAPQTLPAHSSILTGTIPPYHGVHDNIGYQLDESNVTLAEILKGAGFKTAAFISALVLDSKFGMNQGFDNYNDQFEKQIAVHGYIERKGLETSRLTIEWLEKNKNERFFLFLHYFDPHFNYEPPEPFASRFAPNTYAGEIAYTDYCIGLVIQKLKDMNLYDSALIIITADHGEMLSEHGELTHGYFIYESAVKVPLIFKLPGQNKSSRIKSIAGLIDIVPTVCSLLNIETPKSVQGMDLSACFKGKNLSQKDRSIYCESVIPTKYNANSLLGVVTDRFKYIQTTRPELYDLIEDPRETNDLIEKEPHRARILKDKLEQILAESVRAGNQSNKIELDAAARKKLESLGYVGASTAGNLEFDQAKEDPKDAFGIYSIVIKILFLKYEGKFDQAHNLCEKLLAQHPNYFKAHKYMAEIAVARKDFALTVPHFTKFLELEPNDPEAHNDRGFAYSLTGKYDLAMQDFKQALNLNIKDTFRVYNNRGIAYTLMGEYDMAIKDFEKSIQLNPTYDNALKNMGIAMERQGKAIEAVSYYRRALDQRQDWPEVLNYLAWILATSEDAVARDTSEALRLAERACELTNHKNPIFLDTLAAALAANGRFDAAVKNATKALKICQEKNMVPSSMKIQKHLDLFKQNKTPRR